MRAKSRYSCLIYNSFRCSENVISLIGGLYLKAVALSIARAHYIIIISLYDARPVIFIILSTRGFALARTTTRVSHFISRRRSGALLYCMYYL